MTTASRLIVYVDGFNLYHGLHDTSRYKYLWLDLVQLAKILRPQDNLVKVKYFTAQVLGDPEAQARQNIYLDALTLNGSGLIEIIQGRYQRKTKQCRSCNSSWISYEEKQTDVNIAVEIVADAAEGLADSQIIISADSDLAPAVEMSRRLNPNLFIAAAFPPGRKSFELKKIMPASFDIYPARLAKAQLPDVVSGVSSAITYKRPSKWS